MTRLVTALLATLLLCLTVAGMVNADALARQSQSVSLRWQQALENETAAEAREKQPGLTLWGQTEDNLIAGWRQVQATLITYQGDPVLVWDPVCLSGALPAPLDETGCAVSAALAWALFGSEDAVGLTLTWGDAVYTVRGIFDGEGCLALLPDEAAAFTAAELPADGETWQDPAAWVEAQLRTSGLPDPDWALYPAGPALLARMLAWLPLAFAAGVLAAALWQAGRRQALWKRDAVGFVLLLTAALALPVALAAWPAWLTPSRWSDFAWWGRLAQQLREQGGAWLAAPCQGRDLSFKTGLLAQTGLAALQCALCEALRCRLRAAPFAESGPVRF